MPPSTPDSSSEAAVSEVLGTILTFFVVTSILAVALLVFRNEGQEATREAGINGAEGVADRVAEGIEALLTFVENHPGATVALNVDLPGNLAGAGYVVRIVPASATACNDSTPATSPLVTVQRDGDCVRRPVAGSVPLGRLCDTSVGGGPLAVSYQAAATSSCPGNSIFLGNPS